MADPYPFRGHKQFPPSTSSREPNPPITRARRLWRLSALFRNLLLVRHLLSYRRLAINAPWMDGGCCLLACFLGRGSYVIRMAYPMHKVACMQIVPTYLGMQSLFRTRRPRSMAKRRTALRRRSLWSHSFRPASRIRMCRLRSSRVLVGVNGRFNGDRVRCSGHLTRCTPCSIL